jgi:uncharacterized protein (TIGR00255 family)
MMRSMTGYGSGAAEARQHNLNLRIEITSVNRKTLDLNVSGPKEWTGIDQKFAEWLKGSFERGRLQIQIKLAPLGDQSSGLNELGWNEDLMAATLDRMKCFAEKHGLQLEANGRLLLELARTLEQSSGQPDWRELGGEIEIAFKAALDDLDGMRLREGAALKKDLLERISSMERLLEEITNQAEHTVEQYRDALLERLAQLGLEIDTSDDRVLKEVAIFADRCDISEEITRLGSHFDQFRDLLESSEPSGRKMDFLCQEIHREFNTTGSKSNRIEITRAVIEGKNTLERIREQVQNIE